MTISRGGFAALLSPGLQKVFLNEFDVWEPEYTEIYNIDQSNKQFEEEQLITGFGIMNTKTEGAAVTYEDISQGYTTRYTHTTFEKAVRITQEMYEDDLYGVMKNMVGALARSAKQRMEVDGASTFNNAFSSSFVGADGVALISAVHPLSIGGTQSNALAASSDLTVASLQEAVQVLETCQDEKGVQLALRAKTLLVPPARQWQAYELTGSQYKPGVSDNEINVLKGKGIVPVVNHYLTDTNNWFLLADDHKVTWKWRVKLSFFTGNDFDTDDAKSKARMRYSKGFTDWRGVTGSNPS